MTPETTGQATYCPEDDKLRLYVGRVPREEYLALRAQGWTSTSKQDCDFVAVWTAGREDTALEYSGGILEDEDQDPPDRAADRAERFSGYRDKREGEALQLADRYDSGPAVHGYQSQALAERRAARHDAVATRAGNQWDKAGYWQSRTAGVIAHALHKQAPGVRMGRIKTIEKEIRAAEKALQDAGKRHAWIENLASDPAAAVVLLAPTFPRYYIGEAPEPETPGETFERVSISLAEEVAPGYGTKLTHPRHPERVDSVSALMRTDDDPLTLADVCAWYLGRYKVPEEGRSLKHLRLRLEYENQMLEAQGGRLASVDMEPGGFIGSSQIITVHKSPATGRVTSVKVKVPKKEGWNHRIRGVAGADYDLMQIETERLTPDAYRAPTDEEREAFKAWQKADKAARAERTPKAPPLINPTDEDAERLQDALNAEAKADYLEHHGAWVEPEDFRGSTVQRMTQDKYKAMSAGSYGRAETTRFCEGGKEYWGGYTRATKNRPVSCKLRTTYGDGNTSNKAKSIIILTDKPQKPLPAAVWAPAEGTEGGAS